MSWAAVFMCWRFMLPLGLLGVPTVTYVMSVSMTACWVWLTRHLRLPFWMLVVSFSWRSGSWNGGVPWLIFAAFSASTSEAKTV